VWHVQDFISERTFGIYRRAFGLAARFLPEQIIVDGNSIAEQLPQSLRPRITVILNGVDTKLFRPGLDGTIVRQELDIPHDDLVIGNLGRMTPWKGQHYLIEAFASIAGDNPNVTLLLIGSPVFDNDSYQRRLLKTVADLGLEGRVKLPGYRHDTANVLAAMDIFAFTSVEKDTSPLALLSAMASGLPIVSFDIAGARELMADDNQFLVVPVADVARLSDALASVVANENLREFLATAARKQAVSEFDVEIYRERIEQVFRKVLLKGRVGINATLPEGQRTASELQV
jgi:glycosyltransferase involved in cell wall biosynthesis